MLARPSAELLDFVIVHELLQIDRNLHVVSIRHRHCVEVESILRLEVPIEADNDGFQLLD